MGLRGEYIGKSLSTQRFFADTEYMNYWWVNQGKTYEFEVPNNILWSPKESQDGSYNQNYHNMTLLKPGDLVFSYKEKEICAVGIVQGNARTSLKPEFRTRTSWAKKGWLVDTEFTELRTPFEPSRHMVQIRPLLPDKYSPLRSNGKANQAYLFAISNELGELLLSIAGLSDENLETYSQILTERLDDEHEAEIIQRTTLRPLEKEQLIKARRGQGVFKDNVKKFENRCRITGVSEGLHLVASHIKPWSLSSDAEKIDGENGLLLAPHVDHLFDGGSISFEDDGSLIISAVLNRAILSAWNLGEDINIGSLTLNQRKYLAYHRENRLLPRKPQK